MNLRPPCRSARRWRWAMCRARLLRRRWYAALVSGILRSLTPQHLLPAKLLQALNDALQERKLDSQYVTMLIALWDDADSTLRVANAASVQPLLVTRSDSPTDALQVKAIDAQGFALGWFPNTTYDEIVVQTQPGDLVIFCSDGITDATNSQGEMFGNERLGRIACPSPQCSRERTAGGGCDPRGGSYVPRRHGALRR